MTLRAHGIPGSYDLDGLRAIHRYLFGDVYEWAGQLRTVNLVKGEPFAPVEQIQPILRHLAEVLRDTDQLRRVPETKMPEALARLYHVVNVAHPFREGNGRTQREFITALAGESGHGVDWAQITGRVNDHACLRAGQGDLEPLTRMFTVLVSRAPNLNPPHPNSAEIGASYPKPATQATAHGGGGDPTPPVLPAPDTAAPRPRPAAVTPQFHVGAAATGGSAPRGRSELRAAQEDPALEEQR